MHSRAIKAAVTLAVVEAAIAVVGAGILLATPGNHAGTLVRKHPTISHATAVAVQYILAATVLVIAVLVLVAAGGLWRGRRWAWITLLGLGVLELQGLTRNASVVSTLEQVPNVVMLVCLLLPTSRAFVRKESNHIPSTSAA